MTGQHPYTLDPHPSQTTKAHHLPHRDTIQVSWHGWRTEITGDQPVASTVSPSDAKLTKPSGLVVDIDIPVATLAHCHFQFTC